ncbi:MAG: phosphate ABC transporter substrate-binding protein PstS [Burkholderiaceae bacterium]
MKKILSVLATSAVAAVAFSAQAANITGAGASFPAPIYAKWAEAYRAATGHLLNYQAIGSGGGVRQITSKTVDFGASDDPISGADLDKAGLVQFPAVIGGIVPVMNIDGVAPGQLKLNGTVLADIFRGAITQWNDPAIAALNSGVNLPSTAITLVYRSDSSGTTAAFTDYLVRVSPEFKEKVGAGKTVNWPVGVGGKGNAGVAASVSKIKGGVGYVEYAYAKQNRMTHASLINREGQALQPDERTFAAAAAHADWSAAPGFGVNLNDQPGADAWPIVTASFILMHKTADKPERSVEVLKFFKWALENGQQMAIELDYVPLPASVVKLIEASWNEIRDSSGRSILAH